MTPDVVKTLDPKLRPPAWTLRLCEEILDECCKAEAETGAGGARAMRNAQRAAAGEGFTPPLPPPGYQTICPFEEALLSCTKL